MKKSVLIALILALTAAGGAHAGGRHHGHGFYGHGYYGGPHRIGYGHYYGHRYGRHYGGRHYRRHHRDRYGYLAAGLLLGGIAVHALNRPTVVRERVVYRRPIERTVVRVESAPAYQYEPVPAEPPPYYYRKDPDGNCWLIERAEDGSETITPQDPRICG